MTMSSLTAAVVALIVQVTVITVSGLKLPLGGNNSNIAECEAVIITTHFTQLEDWERKLYHSNDLQDGEHFYESIFKVPEDEGHLKVVILHDGLPDKVVQAKQNSKVEFVKVDYESRPDAKHMGVNDIRFLFVNQLVKDHPEWKVVFLTDMFDVTLHHNPCRHVMQNPTKLFVGREEPLNPNFHMAKNWVGRRLREMGDYYYRPVLAKKEQLRPNYVYNAGISGGTRDVYLEFLARLEKVLLDKPHLECAYGHRTCNINMGAFYYVAFMEYDQKDIVCGYPLHSEFKTYDNATKADIQHKFGRLAESDFRIRVSDS